jgi:type IV pilus assembly protein PilX
MLRPVDRRRHGLATASNNRQPAGVVLLVALIVLVALTLAGVALVRSVDTANLDCRQPVFSPSRRSRPASAAPNWRSTNWLKPNNTLGNTTLHTDSAAGYVAATA